MAEYNNIPEYLYFHGEEIENFYHVQIPLSLVKDKVFSDVSDSAKILYGLLLNRTCLSIRNGWLDKNNRTYINYTIKNVMEDMNIGETKAKKIFAELCNISGTGIGLIEKVRVLNKPSRIYVLNFIAVCDYIRLLGEDHAKCRENADLPVGRKCDPPSVVNATHRQSQMRPTVSRECDPPSVVDATENYINISNTNKSNIDISQSVYDKRNVSDESKDVTDRLTDVTAQVSVLNDNKLYRVDELGEYLSYPRLRELLSYHHFMEECSRFNLTQLERKQRATEELKVLIDYQALKETPQINMDLVDALLEYMTDVIAIKESIRIRDTTYDADMMGNRFFELDMFTIQHVLEKIETFTSQNRISNIRNYYLKCLMSAKSDMRTSIQGEVNYDLAHWNDS